MAIRIAQLTLLGALALGIYGLEAAGVSCSPIGTAMAQDDETVAESSEPVAAVDALVIAIRDNDVDSLLHAVVGHQIYPELRAGLEDTEPAAESESQRFAENLAAWTAPDAVETAMTSMAPMIAALKPQIQGGISALQAQVGNAPAEVQPHAAAVLAGMAAWAEANAFDEEQIRAALSELQQTVIALDLTTLDALKALPYDQKMAKAGELLAGFKRALLVFDFDLDAIADSVTAEPGSGTGASTTVKTGVTLFGVRIDGEMPMIQLDDQWYTGLTGIALVTYSDYLARAQVQESLLASGAAKTALSEYWMTNSAMPEAGHFDVADAGRYASLSHDDAGVITVSLHNDEPVARRVRGYQLQLSPQFEDGLITHWTCVAQAGADRKYLPASCR